MVRIKDPEQTARWFRALGDETRLRILERLSEGEQCVCDLTDALDAGQSLMSFHLRTLKDAGLLRDRREGRWVYYSLDPATIGSVQEWMSAFAEAAREMRRAAHARTSFFCPHSSSLIDPGRSVEEESCQRRGHEKEEGHGSICRCRVAD